jgi:hypothetical protein
MLISKVTDFGQDYELMLKASAKDQTEVTLAIGDIELRQNSDEENEDDSAEKNFDD